MINFLLALGVFSFLLILLWSSVMAGRFYGQKRLARHTEHKLEVVSVAEAAIFGLLGLLIAFTFSGAYERFEQRKVHIIEEASAFERAYERVDLLPSNLQSQLRLAIREYLDMHLATYKALPNLHLVARDVIQAKQLQDKIWKQLVAASMVSTHEDLAQLSIMSFNDMFESANAGLSLAKLHSPPMVMALLIGLAMLGALLAGYITAENHATKSLHILCYVLLTAFTIYVIIDLEFPRIGLIRVDSFDQILIDVRDGM